MKININQVHGTTTKTGSKQNRSYDLMPTETPDFFRSVNNKGESVTVWNVNGDWSKIGISIGHNRRMSYTTNFKIGQ